MQGTKVRHRTPEELHMSRALYSLVALIAITLVGSSGYHFIERWDWLDSGYMVFITLSTVGFQEVAPLSPLGRVWTILLLITGVGTGGFLAANLLEFAMEGHFRGFRRRRLMEKHIRSMKDHYIVCGYGRVGQEVVSELLAKGRDVVVIDQGPAEKELELGGIPFLQGNATTEEVLLEAGIKTAFALISAIDSDTENVFAVLSARVLNPSIKIIARASERETSRKLKMVGADRVVSPYVTSGRRMAAMAFQPEVVDFLDYFTQPLQDIELEIGAVQVEDESSLAGRTLGEADLRRKSGAMVLAVRSSSGMLFNPGAETVLEPGASLMILGTTAQFEKLETMARA